MIQTSEKRIGAGRFGAMAVLACVVVLIISCGRSSDQEVQEGEGLGTLSDKTELLDRRYTYLLRGDDGFPTLTSGYRMKTNPVDDGISVITLVPDKDRPTDNGDSCQTIKIDLKKPEEVLAVVSDSVGSGMVTFDFGELPVGNYTLFTGEFPPEMQRWTKDCKRLVIYIAVGKFIRHRARWNVTDHGRLSHELDF